MRDTRSGLSRVLVVHPDVETRRALEQALRRLADGPLATYEASSLAEGAEAVRALDPRIVFLDLTDHRELALDVAREGRQPDRLIIGLFNPLVAQGSELDFLREAVRAGIGDFVALPVSDTELESVLRAAQPAEVPGERLEEGRVITFFSHKGGVGTTTLAVNFGLAAAAASGGVGDVALLDAAIQWGDASALLGLAPGRDLLGVVRDLGTIVALPTYLTEHPTSGLRVLASPRDPVAAEGVTPEDLSRVLIELRRRFSLVVVDTASPLDALTLAVLDLSDVTYVVTEAVAPTTIGTARLLTLLDKLGFRQDRLRLVLNRHAAFEGNLPAATVAEQIGHKVDHLVGYEPAVIVAANTGVPMVLSHPKTAFAKAIGKMVEEVTASGTAS